MLSIAVLAAESAPDAQGNVVCSGEYTTKYNPEKLNAIMTGLSDSFTASENEGRELLAQCMEIGTVMLDYYITGGGFVPFAELYGTVTANTATNKIEITDGALMPLEMQERQHVLNPVLIRGKSITLQFMKDAQQKIKPMFKLSKDGIYVLEIGNAGVFFGCEEKDASGRALSCAMSGQLYKEGDAEAYLTITGSGFVSEDVGGFSSSRLSSVYVGPKNIKEAGESLGDEVPDDLVAIPLRDLKEIEVYTAPSMRTDYAYQLQAKAQTDTSMIDDIKVKSNKEIQVVNFIDNYKPDDGSIGLVKIMGIDNVMLNIDSGRMSEGMPFMATLASEGPEAPFHRISVFRARSKLAESSHEIYVFPESAEAAYDLIINSGSATPPDSLLLKPSTHEMKIFSAYSALEVALLPSYNTVTITPSLERGMMQGSVKVTNPNNNAWIMYENEELTWTPGKTISQLGFNFNVNLNPALGEAEMLSCATDGTCWLGSTMVIAPGGLTQEKLSAAMAPARERRQAEEGQKAAAGCDSIEDCPTGRYCDLSMDEPECKRIGRISCSEEELCVAGLYCDAGRCRDIRGVSCENDEECPENYACDAELKLCTMPSGQMSFGVELGKTQPQQVSGEEFGEEKGIFRKAWNWIKGLFA